MGRNPAAIERSSAVSVNTGRHESLQVSVRQSANELYAVGVRLLNGSVSPPYDLRPVHALLEWRDEKRAQ